MPQTLQWQVVATLGEFGQWDSISGGGISITHTDYTPAGERSPRKLPATFTIGDITLSRAYVPERDNEVNAWVLRYKEGLDAGRVIIICLLNDQKVVVQTRTYALGKPMSLEFPEGMSGGAGLAEIKLGLACEAVAI